MKKHIFPVLIAICLALEACGTTAATESAAKSVSVYRELRPEYQTGGKLLQAEKITMDSAADSVQTAVSALNSSPQSEKLENPLPNGVELLDASLQGNCVTAEMNSAYLDVTGFDKTLIDCCITMTMCSIEGVDYVTVCVDGETVADKLSSEDFLLFNTVKSLNTAKVQIYFPKVSSNTLGSEYRSISFDDNNSAERCILDSLLGGPAPGGGLKRPFPADTVLLSVYTQDGVCTVSLTDFTSEVQNPTATDAELSIYSLVDSLTEFSDVQSVQILINGSKVPDIWGFDISHPLSRNAGIIGSVTAEQAETNK